VSAMLLLGFFLSPVLYSTQWLPPAVQIVAALNPMTGLLGLYRSAVLGVPLPSALSVLALGVAIVGVALWARAVFGRLRPVLDEYW
jgi:ABC-2 type transport system permease protein